MLGAYLKTGQAQVRYCDAMPMSCSLEEGQKVNLTPFLQGRKVNLESDTWPCSNLQQQGPLMRNALNLSATRTCATCFDTMSTGISLIYKAMAKF